MIYNFKYSFTQLHKFFFKCFLDYRYIAAAFHRDNPWSTPCGRTLDVDNHDHCCCGGGVYGCGDNAIFLSCCH